MADYMNAEGAALAIGVCYKTFMAKHRKRLPTPTALNGKRGLYWKAADVRRYAKESAKGRM